MTEDEIKTMMTGRINIPVPQDLEFEFLKAFCGSKMGGKAEFGRIILREGLAAAKAHGITVKC